jgi:hypothetical protein
LTLVAGRSGKFDGSDTGFPPFAALVLAVARDEKRCTGQQFDKFVVFLKAIVEGLKLGALGPQREPPLLTVGTTLRVLSGGRRGSFARADVLADDSTVDAAAAGVVTPAAQALFPGHGSPRKRGSCNRVTQHRRAIDTADGLVRARTAR